MVRDQVEATYNNTVNFNVPSKWWRGLILMCNASKPGNTDYYVGLKLATSLVDILKTNDLVVSATNDPLLISVKPMYYQPTGYPSVINILYLPIA